MPELYLTRRARRDLAQLPELLRKPVLEALEDLQIDPELRGKRLVGWLSGLWSARVGNYRILYTTEAGCSRAIVRAIRHRGVAYGEGPASE